jgi:hypothetical protein
MGCLAGFTYRQIVKRLKEIKEREVKERTSTTVLSFNRHELSPGNTVENEDSGEGYQSTARL